MSDDFDLLGDPIPEGFGKRGRPPHRADDEKRRLVIQLLAFDWSPERISAALNITPPTLRKHYFRELRRRAEARSAVEAKLLGKLMDESEAGNVSAIDKYLKRLDKHDLAQLAEQVKTRGEAKADKVGKKVERQQAASSVSGLFAPPAPPRRLDG